MEQGGGTLPRWVSDRRTNTAQEKVFPAIGLARRNKERIRGGTQEQEQEVEFGEQHEEFEEVHFEDSEFFVEAEGDARGHLPGRRESEQQAEGQDMGHREREESVQVGGIDISHRGREESFGCGGGDNSQHERHKSIGGGGIDPGQHERSGSVGQGANDAGGSDENVGGHGGGRQSRLNSEGFGDAL
ncbi:hypothetical protein H2202_000227 [Exophiala xenobiotica]|nr:hypothetical protein H2202_000227 [Exophiala xenobiotica]